MSIHPMAKDTGVLDILIKHYVPDLRLANQCSWLERGCCFSQPTPHERKRGYSLSQPYKHIIPRIRGYVNPLYDIFLFNQQLILLPSYPRHK